MTTPNGRESVLGVNETGTVAESTGVQRGEVLLTVGALLFIFTIALTHFVMGIFLAFIPGVLALAFLAAAVTRARSSDAHSNRSLGILLLFAGFCILTIVGFQACGLSYQAAFHNYRPSSPAPEWRQWARAVITWFLPAAFVLPGLRHWTIWSARRRLVWSIITFAVPLAIIVTHQILVQIGFPLTA